jgi:hypothetical protein
MSHPLSIRLPLRPMVEPCSVHTLLIFCLNIQHNTSTLYVQVHTYLIHPLGEELGEPLCQKMKVALSSLAYTFNGCVFSQGTHIS